MDTTHLSYIATNLEELMLQARPEVQELIQGKEVDDTVAILGKLYKLPISSYLALDNLVLFILLGALKPEDVVRGIMDILGLSEEEAYKLATDLDKTILEKARIKIFDKDPSDMVTLTLQEGRSPDELRKEILDTTKRDPVPVQAQVGTRTVPLSTLVPKQKVATGTRSQLMEQLEILGSIPNDEEVADRLQKIQEQITSIQAKNAIKKEGETAQKSEVQIATPEIKSATYSRAPTKYNVDPYREVSEES